MSTNFPKNEAELRSRLAVIKRGVPNQGNNKSKFAIPAFQLFVDCELVTPENIAFLSDKRRCDKYFGCTMNPLGGVLRHQDLLMFDDGNVWRYYFAGNDSVYVTLNGIRYYVSNNWQYGCKESFFKWLAMKVMQKIDVISTPPDPIPSEPTPPIEELIQTLLKENKDLIATNKGLCSLVTTLDIRIGKLEEKIDELKRAWE